MQRVPEYISANTDVVLLFYYFYFFITIFIIIFIIFQIVRRLSSVIRRPHPHFTESRLSV